MLPHTPTLMFRSAPFAAVLALAATAAFAQTKVPTVTFARPDAEYAEPFDNVNGIRELRDGRVIVSDGFAKTVTLVDLARGRGTAIGREGQGPNEFSLSFGVVALAADTTLIVDPVQRRFLQVAPDGKPAGNVAWPEGAGGMMQVRAADRQGRLYFQGTPFGLGMEIGSTESPDSVPVIRWDRKTNTFDTLGMVRGPDLGIKTSGSARERNVMIRAQPFSPQDDWSVTPDGRVGVARVGDYHVEWWDAAGKKVAGPAVRYDRVKVAQADKDEVIKAAQNPRGGIVIRRGGGGGAAPSAPRPPVPDFEFPEYKPPFVDRHALAAPDGQLWVRRSMPTGAAPIYDVFDAQGRLVRQVALPKRARVVGFGASSVYVARADEDDLQWLGRYRR